MVTVCDNANESCPAFPGKVKRLHVGFADPPKLVAPSRVGYPIDPRHNDPTLGNTGPEEEVHEVDLPCALPFADDDTGKKGDEPEDGQSDEDMAEPWRRRSRRVVKNGSRWSMDSHRFCKLRRCEMISQRSRCVVFSSCGGMMRTPFRMT